MPYRHGPTRDDKPIVIRDVHYHLSYSLEPNGVSPEDEMCVPPTNGKVPHIDGPDEKALPKLTNSSYPVKCTRNKSTEEHHDECEEKGLCKQVLDLYLPKGEADQEVTSISLKEKVDENEQAVSKPAPPLIVFVHGGGWKKGHTQDWKDFLSSYDTNLLCGLMKWCYGQHGNIGESFSQRGYACALVTYPLARPGALVRGIEYIMSSFMSFLVTCLPSAILAFFLMLPISTRLDPPTIQNPKAWIIFALITLAVSNLTLFIIVAFAFSKNYGTRTVVRAIVCTFLLMLSTLPIWLPVVGVPIVYAITTGCVCVTLVVHVYLIADQWLSWRRALFPDNLKAVLNSVAWLQQYGRRTGAFDPNSVILMGHSAGGHLVLMSMIEQQQLLEAGIDRAGIKGIIGVSGVYNLMNMSGRLLRRMFLTPGFSRHSSDWPLSSPVQLLDKLVINIQQEDDDVSDDVNICSGTTCEELLSSYSDLPHDNVSVTMSAADVDFEFDAQQDISLPPILLINAEKDFHLLKDADELDKVLQLKGYHVERKTIPGTSHVNIVRQVSVGSRLSTSRRKRRHHKELEDICCDFIHRILKPDKC